MALNGKKIRVFVVDDSAVARAFIVSGLSLKSNIEIIGCAVNGADALKTIPQLKPDVITSDVEMPDMTGIEMLKKLMPVYPVPAILVSSLNLRVFDALAAGAVDFVRKPDGALKPNEFISTLSDKIMIANYAHVRTKTQTTDVPVTKHVLPLGRIAAMDRVIIGLGASTGGTEATLDVLKRLPADIPPIVIVQHMPPGFTKMYAERLDRLCAMEVREAVDGDELRRGLALIAPADRQCRIVRNSEGYRVSCRPGEKVGGHRPAVDVLFSSMAENVKCKMVGIIMTGMGHDGADGLLAMRKKGAYTIGQDKESSVVYGMPMVAYDIGGVQIQASCEKISDVLLKYLASLSDII